MSGSNPLGSTPVDKDAEKASFVLKYKKFALLIHNGASSEVFGSFSTPRLGSGKEYFHFYLRPRRESVDSSTSLIKKPSAIAYYAEADGCKLDQTPCFVRRVDISSNSTIRSLGGSLNIRGNT